MIYTSNYATVKNHPDAIAISRGKPSWFTGATIIDLAPATWEMVKMKDHDRFVILFSQQLEKLDVHEMARLCDEKILCCWEALTGKNAKTCHREQVRKWFNENGYECKEYGKNTETAQQTAIEF